MRQILTIMIIAVLPGSILAQQVPKTDLFVAFFVKGVVSVNDPTTENLQTNFTITNPGKSPTQVNIQFFSSAGNLLSYAFTSWPGQVWRASDDSDKPV